MRSELVHSGKNVAQISVTIATPHRRADCQQHHIGACNRFRQLADEPQAPRPNMAPGQILQSGLVDRYLAAAERIEPAQVLVDAGNGPAEFGEAGGRDEADVTSTDHADVHARNTDHDRFVSFGASERPA
jgi:hypothetical protein